MSHKTIRASVQRDCKVHMSELECRPRSPQQTLPQPIPFSRTPTFRRKIYTGPKEQPLRIIEYTVELEACRHWQSLKYTSSKTQIELYAHVHGVFIAFEQMEIAQIPQGVTVMAGHLTIIVVYKYVIIQESCWLVDNKHIIKHIHWSYCDVSRSIVQCFQRSSLLWHGMYKEVKAYCQE